MSPELKTQAIGLIIWLLMSFALIWTTIGILQSLRSDRLLRATLFLTSTWTLLSLLLWSIFR